MRTRFKAITAIAATAALALVGCSGPSTGGGGGTGGDGGTEEKPFKVIAFTSGNQTPIGAWWVKATTEKAAELGWDLTMIQGDFDFQKMNPAVESAIGQGADVILDGFTDYASIGSIVTAAKDAGIPIFAIDSGTEPTDSFVINITTDQQGIVDQTVEAFDEALGGLAGKTVMVIGHNPHAGIRMRAGLAAEAFKAAGATLAGGDVQQVTSPPATGRTEALALVADYLAANPNGLDAVWVGWDDAALGAVKAVEEGADTLVSGVDAVSESLAAILAGGPMLATVEQPWPSALDQLIAEVVKYQKDGSLPAKNFAAVSTVLVTKDNAASITPSDKLG